MTSPAPIPTHREHLLTYGPNRAQYLEKFTDEEWWICSSSHGQRLRKSQRLVWQGRGCPSRRDRRWEDDDFRQLARMREALIDLMRQVTTHNLARRGACPYIFDPAKTVAALAPPHPLMDCPKCGQFRGHDHKCPQDVCENDTMSL